MPAVQIWMSFAITKEQIGGELAQVSGIHESSTDYRKFYIHNGTKTMRLRAETK